ncbi:MAG: redoxin domain-containing protein [Chloroflexi bacterium]|nr:redoxin domain-containing protein [Chloroflexota bacterium]
MAQVVSRLEEIQAANADVVTISFAAAHWAHIWLQETKSPFPFLVDAERAVYRAYGLETSFIRSWSPSNMWYHIKAVLQKRETFGKRGNPHQLGGDFIIDAHGIAQLSHPSWESTDRPTLEEILTVLQKINADK